MKLISRGFRAFCFFWWDFLVGDTPELLVAVVVIVVLALVLRHHHYIDIILLPLMTVIFLLASAFRGRQRVAAGPTRCVDPLNPPTD
jgi:hypothetical protein